MVVLIVKRMFVLTDNGTKAMGIEIKDKPRELESGAQIISGNLGKTIQRLRKAYNMSLGDLSEQSGVAKSIISQIERNETNPTLSTVYRLSRALDTTIDEVLRTEGQQVFLEHQLKSGVPILESQDGLCRLAIAGPLNLVDQVQWYDFRAKPHGVLAQARGEVARQPGAEHRCPFGPLPREAGHHRLQGFAARDRVPRDLSCTRWREAHVRAVRGRHGLHAAGVRHVPLVLTEGQ